ncbi:MAG: aspartate aminotransferase family protein [Alphaproteobacteria bacterium]|jgi:glutamate-1-semialdehyde 2,1-aminomutase|nr:aspartate aminotransferase family protein [Alphaproteobacteria bacterium]MBT4085873.1 aspartate aminotransferase family protein [Alphaproteobacteria bacterium]MBT4542654.1 aspartate aminotransferase family protein [Alphaproteobacteria bacterium]MBT7746956.1 aspartate aminotransferase family protein [Alphaproteobacteria bacterium]
MNLPSTPNVSLADAVQEAEAGFVAANPASQAAWQEACASMPGGNTRTVLYFDPWPLTLVRGEGAAVWDADGHGYVDFLGEYTCGLLGHSNEVVKAALEKKLQNGINMGGPGIHDAAFAQALCNRFASLDRVRFCNSGTEANLLALNSARAWTGRDLIIVFEGGYHGSGLSFPKGGSNFALPFETLVCPYNDADAARALIAQNKDKLAAVLIEPMLGSGGCIPADVDFLKLLQSEAKACGALFILDEVMTSRLSPGGLQQKLGLDPDLTTLGKYLGGGMSFGAFGGRAEIMDRFDPGQANAWMHAGTFNNNVLTMAAGLAAVTEVLTDDALNRVNALGDQLRDRLNEVADDAGAPVHVSGIGSLMAIHFENQDPDLLKLLQFDLIAAGVYLPRRGMIVLSLPMTETDIGDLVDAFAEFVESRAGLLAA